MDLLQEPGTLFTPSISTANTEVLPQWLYPDSGAGPLKTRREKRVKLKKKKSGGIKMKFLKSYIFPVFAAYQGLDPPRPGRPGPLEDPASKFGHS